MEGFILGVLASPLFYILAFIVLMVLESSISDIPRNRHGTDADIRFSTWLLTIIIGCLVYANWQFVKDSWLMILPAIGVYLVIGGLWSLARWKSYCDTIEEFANKEYEDARRRISQGLPVPRRTEYWGSDSVHNVSYETRLNPRNNTSRLFHWIIAWPISLLFNSIEWMVTLVRRSLTGYFQKISADAVSRISEKEAEIKEAESKKE